MKRYFLPVPENLTPMIWNDDDKKYFDALASGWSVYCEIIEDETEPDVYFALSSTFYALDCTGSGDHESNVYMLPTMRCPTCGNRMKIDDYSPGNDPVYSCLCCSENAREVIS